MISNLKNVPPGWQKVRFDEITEIVTDRVEKPSESGLEDYIGLEHLDTDNIRIKRYGSSKDVNATKFLCKKGDIIFGKRRSYLRKVAVSDRDAVVSAHSMVLRPTGDKIHPDFLPCFMQSSIFWKTAHAISEGSMSPTIKWKTLAKQQFWIPGIPEQKKISELLWSIEDNIQKTEKLIETTETLKQGLLNELLTKGIGHTRFKDTELGRIPEEWEVVKLGNYSKNISYGYTDSANEKRIGPKFLRITDIQDGYVDWSNVPYCNCSEKEFAKYKLIDGDIVFARTGATTGKSYLIKNPPISVFASYLIRVSINENYHPEFVSNFFKSSIYWMQINSQISGSAQGGVNAKKLSNLKIVLPELNEQQKISKFFEELECTIKRYIEHIEKLAGLKSKITNELLEGKLNNTS